MNVNLRPLGDDEHIESEGFVLTLAEIARHKRIADTIWNLLALSDPDAIADWIRAAREAAQADQDDGEAWKR